ncbi:hypothetical protein [Tatumella sp. OPLPL6]|uniref:hypothetical protein n=1 Tax=Tatumella sp. OPLPL6 TaxID=1928657 RepID=UPI000C17B654|nr:hypothetical protein [Tatumella sp. OPLPL6]PIJ46153.1 hypothetical protein BOM24_02005 [Tatumella sp. OPLPL6]
MGSLPEVQQSLDLLDKIQQALEIKDFTALLPMAEAYSLAVQHLEEMDNQAGIQQLLAAQEGVETSLYQLQREVNAQIEQVTQDKINHAYQAG